MIPVIKNENDIRRLAGIPIKEDPIDIPPDDDDEAEDWGVPSKPSGSLDNIIAKHREAFESVMRGESSLYDHDEFYDELYEHYVNSGEMPYGIAKARDGDPDQWIQEELDREYGDDFATDDGEPMDGDFDSGMASAGLGTDEDYGYYGESKEPKTFREHLDIVERRLTVDIPGQPTRDLDMPTKVKKAPSLDTGIGIEPMDAPVAAVPMPKKKARPTAKKLKASPKALPNDFASDSEKELMKPNPSGYEEFNLSRAKRGIWPGALLKATQKYHNRDRSAEREKGREFKRKEAEARKEKAREAGKWARRQVDKWGEGGTRRSRKSKKS